MSTSSNLDFYFKSGLYKFSTEDRIGLEPFYELILPKACYVIRKLTREYFWGKSFYNLWSFAELMYKKAEQTQRNLDRQCYYWTGK